jgi:cell filamentation protein
MATDHYTQPETGTLINKLGITDAQALKQTVEATATAHAIARTRGSQPNTTFDAERLQSIHKALHGPVYAWAGQIRSVDLAKGPDESRLAFARVEEVKPFLLEIAAEIQGENNFRGLPKELLSEKLAKTYADLNATHPFRDGNDRASRQFITELAADSGYRLDLSRVAKQTWEQASRDSLTGDLQGVQREIATSLRAEREIAFSMLGKDEALKKHPELDGAFKLLERALDPMALAIPKAQTDPQGHPSSAKRDSPITNLTHARVLDRVRGQLAAGQIPEADISISESGRTIALAAEFRGLALKEANLVPTRTAGTVIAQSSEHVLVKIGQEVAVAYEKHKLDRALQPGDQVSIKYSHDRGEVSTSALSKPMDRDRGRDGP